MKKLVIGGSARQQRGIRFPCTTVLYAQGLGVAQDYQLARNFYEKAVARDYVDFMINLGVMYEDGEGVVLNYE
ncbi:MAG TPA: hypothetical protein VNW97_23405 [Candidatus Saccharimonadales bacterium]|nr:hypothetical protein [Candidatus Saccharimonadales bacterium]